MSRRDMLRRSGTLGVGILAAVQAGCGGSSEEIFVNNGNQNGNPNPTPTPNPNPGNGGLTFLFAKPQTATVPASTTSIEFVYLNSSNAEISSETKTFATSITVFPPAGTVAILLIARDANGFPLLELQGAVTVPTEGDPTVVNLGNFADATVTFISLTVTPPQFDFDAVDQTQQLTLSAGFSNNENLVFPATLLDDADYDSDNDASVAVGNTGLVTAVSAGNATITVSFTDSTGQLRSDTVAVTVIIVNPGPVIPPVDFVQPPVRRSVNGFLSVLMQCDFASNEVGTPYGVRNFYSRTINGTLAPPTIRLKPGDHLEIPIDNLMPADTNEFLDPPTNMMLNPQWEGPLVDPNDENIPHEFNTVNMHTHGFHVSPIQDNVVLQIPPENSYVYKYDIPTDHPDGTYWYHPHKHGATAMHLHSGMAGMIIIEGALEQVPEIAAAADVAFVINELNLKGVSNVNVIAPEYYCPNNTGQGAFAAADSFYVVNGAYQPRMKVRPGQVVRLRILNASSRGATPLTITGSTGDWNIISFDGLTFPEMRSESEFTLQPANRADVLVRFDSAGTYEITKEQYIVGGGPGGVLPLQILAYVDVEGDPFPQDFPSGPLPVSPTLPNIEADEVTSYRTLLYSTTGGFTINTQKFSSTRIDQLIPLYSVVQWTLTNNSSVVHPHHIHIQDVQVIATSDGFLNGIQYSLPNPGVPPANPADLTGINLFDPPVWMDTVGIPPRQGIPANSPVGWVIIRQRFPDFPGLFVQHCHILTHEDQGMMQLINVQ